MYIAATVGVARTRSARIERRTERAVVAIAPSWGDLRKGMLARREKEASERLGGRMLVVGLGGRGRDLPCDDVNGDDEADVGFGEDAVVPDDGCDDPCGEVDGRDADVPRPGDLLDAWGCVGDETYTIRAARLHPITCNRLARRRARSSTNAPESW